MSEWRDIAITFVFEGDKIAWRQWPAAPRIGESVALPHYENPAATILYDVTDVQWGMPEKPPIAGPNTLTVQVLVTRGDVEVKQYRKRRERG